MSDIKLSICIPTYNRCAYLENTIKSITSQEIFIKTDNIEIVISNNCSTDNTDEICRFYQQKFPTKIIYIKQETPLFPDLHIFKTLEYANGQYLKLNNDTCQFKEKSLQYILEDINKADLSDISAIFFANGNGKRTEIANNFDTFLLNVSYISTWIGAHCYKKEFIQSIKDILYDKIYAKLNQINLIGLLYEQGNRIYIVNNIYFDSIQTENKGGYSILEVFGQNYFSILKEYINKNNGITKNTYEAEKYKILDFINFYYFDFDEIFSFTKGGYLTYMLKLYCNKPYFYVKCCKILFKKIFNSTQNKKHRIYIFLGIKVKIKKK